MGGARASVAACVGLSLIVIGWLLLAVANEPRLRVQSPGRFAHEPADWWVRVWVQPATDDRWIEIAADGTSLYRSIGYGLAGAKAPRVHQVWFRDLPGGCFELTAEIRTAPAPEGKRLAQARADWPLSVLGVGTDGDPCQ